MASVALSTKAPGSVITLNENGAAAEFVVACHNYESGLNGAGRTLLVRKTALADKHRWGSVDSTTDLCWRDRSDLKSWLEETYAARLDEEIRRNIGTIARTAVLLLALTNQLLSAMGKSPLPIESATVEQLVTAGITTIAALIAWWKNNSFTKEAIAADAEYDRLRKRNGK